MIQLYLNTNKNFNLNGDIVLQPSSAIITKDLTDYKDELELIHCIDDIGRWTYIEEDNVIKCPSCSDFAIEDQLYRIYETEKEDDITITARCRHIVFDLMNFEFEYDSISKLLTNSANLTKILTGTGFNGYVDSKISKLNIDFDTKGKNRWEVLVLFAKALKCEIYVSNHSISLLSKIGNQIPQLNITYSKNMKSFNETKNIDDVVTQAKGVYNGYKTAWINSPNHFLDYANPKQKTFELTGMTTILKVDDDGNVTNKDELITEMNEAVLNKFNIDNIDIPTFNYKVNVVDLSNIADYSGFKDCLAKINIGDMIVLNHKKFNISLNIRVISLKFDILEFENSDLELGEKIYDLIEDINKDNKTTADAVSNLNNTVLPAINDIPNKINTAISNATQKLTGELKGEGLQEKTVIFPAEWSGKAVSKKAYFVNISPPSAQNPNTIYMLETASINFANQENGVTISAISKFNTLTWGNSLEITNISNVNAYIDIYYEFSIETGQLT